MKRKKSADPVNDIAQRELMLRRRFTSGKSGNLALRLNFSQDILLAVMGLFAVNQVREKTPRQKVALALAARAFNLIRCAYLLTSSGYPLESLTVVRAVYERLAAVMHVRAHEELAEKWLAHTLKDGDLPKYATTIGDGINKVMEDYQSVRGHSKAAIPPDVIESLKRLYGVLSDFTHPKGDTSPLVFVGEDPSNITMFQYGPNDDERADYFAVQSFLLILALEIPLQMMLFTDLCDSSDERAKSLFEAFEGSVPSMLLEMQEKMAQTQEWIAAHASNINS